MGDEPDNTFEPQQSEPTPQPHLRELVRIFVSPDDKIVVGSALQTPLDILQVLAQAQQAMCDTMRHKAEDLGSRIVLPGKIQGGVDFLRRKLGGNNKPHR